ncbi:hypothetical protein [Devosia sp. 2618]|uniref:hypothetical protein n=1 Tax=Devosia sp. 2618 TaxID=3156454 RepID=UPI0033951EF1
MINRAWHEAHRLPTNAKLDERIAWHLEHARECGCREMPEGVKQALLQRGIEIPARREH